MEAVSSQAPSNRQRNLGQIPSDTAAIGVILDAEHVGDVPELIRSIHNEEANKLLALWRRSLDRFRFCLIAGRLDRRDGGVVGGLAADWNQAKCLLAYSRARFDEIAASGHSFSSVWGLRLTDERKSEVLAIIAATMQTAGTA